MNAKRLSAAADVAAAISIDAAHDYGRIEPFSSGGTCAASRPHKGQIETARRIRQLLAGSEIISRKKTHVRIPVARLRTSGARCCQKDTLDYVEGSVHDGDQLGNRQSYDCARRRSDHLCRKFSW